MTTKNPSERPVLRGAARHLAAKMRRSTAADLALNVTRRPNRQLPSNGDNQAYDTRPMAFTKGLAHDLSGVAKPDQYEAFVDALTLQGTDTGTAVDPAFDVWFGMEM